MPKKAKSEGRKNATAKTAENSRRSQNTDCTDLQPQRAQKFAIFHALKDIRVKHKVLLFISNGVWFMNGVHN